MTAEPRHHAHGPRRHALRLVRGPRTAAGSRCQSLIPFAAAALPGGQRRRQADRHHRRPAGLRPASAATRSQATRAGHAHRPRPRAGDHPQAEVATSWRWPPTTSRTSPRPTPQAKFDRAGEGARAQPRLARHRRPGGDPGRQRRQGRRRGHRRARPSRSSPTPIKAAGGPAYEWRQIDPVNDQDGGEPGGNIRLAFLFNPDRVSFTDRRGRRRHHRRCGGRTTHGKAALSASPGRIDPADPAWKASRKPLVGQFSFRGQPGVRDRQPLQLQGRRPGPGQPLPAAGPQLGDPAHRPGHGWSTRSSRTCWPRTRRPTWWWLGDLNDYQFSPALKSLTAGGVLTDQVGRLPAGRALRLCLQRQLAGAGPHAHQPAR